MEQGTILYDICEDLGPMNFDDFNVQILGLIQIAILPLTQVGAIKPTTSNITAETNWIDIINPPTLESDFYPVQTAIRKYIYINVKLLFDPPTVSSVLEILKEHSQELLWRIRNAYD